MHWIVITAQLLYTKDNINTTDIFILQKNIDWHLKWHEGRKPLISKTRVGTVPHNDIERHKNKKNFTVRLCYCLLYDILWDYYYLWDLIIISFPALSFTGSIVFYLVTSCYEACFAMPTLGLLMCFEDKLVRFAHLPTLHSRIQHQPTAPSILQTKYEHKLLSIFNKLY